MAILNSDHLIEQAKQLIVPPPAGPPRQVDVRRAISAAYYAVFHAVLAAAADQIIGVTKRSDPHYALVYRAIDHKGLRVLCNLAKQPKMPEPYPNYLPRNGLGRDLAAFATAVIELQDKRNTADYDPSVRLKTVDALASIRAVEAALRRLARSEAAAKRAFLVMLLFPPKR